jgi:hypothetical protein
MANPAWQISGQYFETCSCDYLCPCIITGLTRSTHGDCYFAMAYHVDQGQFGTVPLEDLNFVIVGYTPETMDKGNWKVGLLADARATAEQQRALGTIVSGQAGGPLAGLAPLIGTFLGIEARPIQFAGHDGTWSVSVGDLLDEAIEGTSSLSGKLLHLDDTGHPANDRLGLAKATRSHLHAFGLAWDDTSGQNNGHFAPFSWQGG